MPTTDTTKTDALVAKFDEDKLGQALISRGLLTPEEWDTARAMEGGKPAANGEALLDRMVRASFLTRTQARRVSQDLAQLLSQPIPGYQFLDKLGKGSMGTVFKARQLSMNRLVAVKILHPRLAANRDFLDRFQREAHLAAKFSSNHVVQAIDVGSAGNLHYFVMEYVDGVTIRDELNNGKIYEEREAVEIVLQIAQALQLAHRRQLIHRDIKPANIIITPEGIAKLADLGMARETDDYETARAEKGMTIGTPYYIAPEQIKSKSKVDSKSDIYSLGATLYHMVTGQPPFPYNETDRVLKAHLVEELTRPDELNPKLSRGLGDVVSMMLAKKRQARYPSPEGLIIDLECLLRDEPPKIARKDSGITELAALAEGEAEERPSDDEDYEEAIETDAEQMVPIFWLYVLGAALALSVVLNLVLAVR